MILFGIDQSLSCTGVAIFDTVALTLEMGTLPTTDKKKFNIHDHFQRYAWIEEMIDTLITLNNPAHIFTEMPMYRTYGITGIQLELILKYNLFYKKHSIEFTTMPCTKAEGWPQTLGSKKTKEEFAKLIQPYCDFTITNKDYDMTDATGIVLGGAKQKGWFDGDLSTLTYTKATF